MAWEYSPKEFVKMYRKFMQWEWYTDVNTKALFIHCLLKANWKPGSWKGIHYEAGEFITSLPSLAEETGLSIQQIRTSLVHLISTGEIASSSTDKSTGKKLTKCRIITVNNWNQYQSDNRQNNSQSTCKSTGNQQATNRQPTADIRNKEYIRTKEEKNTPPISPSAGGVCELWNSLVPDKQIDVDDIDQKRMNGISRLIDKYGEETVKSVMSKIPESRFLKCGSENGWNGATFDWFIVPDNFRKIMEGQYDDDLSRSSSEEEESEWQ